MGGGHGHVQMLAGKPSNNLTLCFFCHALSLFPAPPFQTNTTFMDQMGQQVHATTRIPGATLSLPLPEPERFCLPNKLCLEITHLFSLMGLEQLIGAFDGQEQTRGLWATCFSHK